MAFDQPDGWSRIATIRDPMAAHQLDIVILLGGPIVAKCKCGNIDYGSIKPLARVLLMHELHAHTVSEQAERVGSPA